ARLLRSKAFERACMIDNNRPDVKPGMGDTCADDVPRDRRAPTERTVANKEKPKSDGDGIAELGDELGGPA
ncbi:MAG: hypothetical protein ABSC06_04580, partial [Rhodopila sp.]